MGKQPVFLKAVACDLGQVTMPPELYPSDIVAGVQRMTVSLRQQVLWQQIMRDTPSGPGKEEAEAERL